MTRESDFQRLQPKITELTSAQAKQHYDDGEEILSLNGKRVALSHFILMLATDKEVFGPYLLNSVCARALHAILEAEGFGPQKP
jgi:hypothetical protein